MEKLRLVGVRLEGRPKHTHASRAHARACARERPVGREIALAGLTVGLVARRHACTPSPAHPRASAGLKRTGRRNREMPSGTYSYSHHQRGTCSHNGGVAVWLKNRPGVNVSGRLVAERPPLASLSGCCL